MLGLNNLNHMNETQPEEPDDRLKDLLEEWKVEGEAPSTFEAGVWRKIDSSRQDEWSPMVWVDRWLAGLCSPAIAGALAAVVISLAWAGGLAQSRTAEAQAMQELRGQYVAAIDPLARLSGWEAR